MVAHFVQKRVAAIQLQTSVGLIGAIEGREHRPYLLCIGYRNGDRPGQKRRPSLDVVTPYNNFRRLRLSVAQERDFVQYLKSLVPRLVAKISWIKVTSAGEPVAQ